MSKAPRKLFDRLDEDGDGIVAVSDIVVALKADANVQSLIGLIGRRYSSNPDQGIKTAFDRLQSLIIEHPFEITWSTFDQYFATDQKQEILYGATAGGIDLIGFPSKNGTKKDAVGSKSQDHRRNGGLSYTHDGSYAPPDDTSGILAALADIGIVTPDRLPTDRNLPAPILNALGNLGFFATPDGQVHRQSNDAQHQHHHQQQQQKNEQDYHREDFEGGEYWEEEQQSSRNQSNERKPRRRKRKKVKNSKEVAKAEAEHSCLSHESALQLLRGGTPPRLRSPRVRSPRFKSEEKEPQGSLRRSTPRRKKPVSRPVVTETGELNARFNEMHFHGGTSAMRATRSHCLGNGTPIDLNRSIGSGRKTNPLNASTWEKEAHDRVSGVAVPIGTLDRVGTRAACPVHLIGAKKASYNHVTHKVDTPNRSVRKLAWAYPTPRPTDFLGREHDAWR
jgi:hypothetical protein